MDSPSWIITQYLAVIGIVRFAFEKCQIIVAMYRLIHIFPVDFFDSI